MLVGFFSKTLNQEKDKWVEEKKKASPTYVFPGWDKFNVADIKTSSTATVYAQLIPNPPQGLSNAISYTPCTHKFSMVVHASDSSAPEGKRVVNETQFGLKCARELVRMFTKEADVVLDLCAGSGSFSVAALLERRYAITLDSDPTQKEGFVARVKLAQPQVEEQHTKLSKKTTKAGKPFDYNPLTTEYLSSLN